MKMSKDDIQAMLNKAVESVIGTEEKDDKSSDLEKSVKTLSAQVKALSDLASNGFEKPKTVEDIVKDAISPITKQIEEISKKVNGESDKPKMPETVEELNEMIAKAISNKNKVDKKPKGQSKDSMDNKIDDLDESDLASIIKSIVKDDDSGDDSLDVEKEDVNGNVLTKTQRKNRQELDDYLGKMIGKQEARFKDNVEDEEDEEDEDEGDEE